MEEYIMMDILDRLHKLSQLIDRLADQQDKQLEVMKDVREYLNSWSLAEGYMEDM